MKTLGKMIISRIITVLVVILLILGTVFVFKNNIKNFFAGTSTAEYNFVIKRFSKKTELLVADAETKTTQTQSFTSKTLQDWPDWTRPITRFFVSRDLVVEIPVKTEFKIDLKHLTKEDIKIDHGVLTFKKPLVVNIDSQKDGALSFEKNSSGLIDRIVDFVTASQEAQKFLDEKTNEMVYQASQSVLKKKKDKVIEASEEALTQVVNLNSDKKLKVSLKESDLTFKIIDQK